MTGAALVSQTSHKAHCDIWRVRSTSRKTCVVLQLLDPVGAPNEAGKFLQGSAGDGGKDGRKGVGSGGSRL